MFIARVLTVLIITSSVWLAEAHKRSEMKHIAIVMDTSCDAHRAPEMAALLKKMVEMHHNIQAHVLDIATFSLDFISQKLPPKMATDTADPAIKKWSHAIQSASGFIFIVPEHNNAYPGSLKNALDLLYHEWNAKPAGLVVCSATDAGVELVAHQMRSVLEELKMIVAEPVVLLTSTQPLLFVENLKKSFQIRAMIETLCEHTAPAWYKRLWNRFLTVVTRVGFLIVRPISQTITQYQQRSRAQTLSSDPQADQAVHLNPKVRVAIVVGSTRQERLSLPIATMIKDVISAAGGTAELVDLYNYPLALACHDTLARELDLTAARLQHDLSVFDGFIMVVPEYNAGIPGVLKNALDLAGRALYKKPVAFVGHAGGPGGGINVHDHLVSVLQALHAILIAKPLYIPVVWRLFNARGQIGNQHTIQQQVAQIALVLNNFCMQQLVNK